MAQLQHLQKLIEKYTQRVAQLQLSKQTVPLHLTLGKLYEKAGKKDEAIQEFAKVALFYADKGQVIKAMAAAQLAVRIDPKNEEMLDRLGELYFLRQTVSNDQLEEYQESLKQIDILQQAQPQTGSAIGETEEAEETDVTHFLKQVPLLSKLSISELRGIQSHSTLRHYVAGEPVLTAGNVNRSLFVILQGTVKIFGKNKNQETIHLATLEHGNSFGEFALFGKIDPRLSVIADQESTILEIPRDIILKLAKTRPQITQTLKDMFRRRILDTAISRVPLFSQLAPQDRQKIITHFKAVRAKQGTTLVSEGARGDSMYFILAGNVGVYTSLMQDDDGVLKEEHLLLATLKHGDFFGEQALVTDEPRSATVKALSDVSLLKLRKEDLEAVIQQHPWIESTLQIEAFENRMRTNLSVLSKIAPADEI